MDPREVQFPPKVPEFSYEQIFDRITLPTKKMKTLYVDTRNHSYNRAITESERS